MLLFAASSPASLLLLRQLQADWNLFGLCAPLFPVTPGLILMLNYFSFANDVAQLQSTCLNMHGGCEERTGFMEMRPHRCCFYSCGLLHY